MQHEKEEQGDRDRRQVRYSIPTCARRRLVSKYFVIEPEVAGGWGKNTAFTKTAGVGTVVHKLHYVFDGWLGDELLESTPCFIVTEKLQERILRAGLTGANFDDIEVSKSEQFNDLYPDRELPKFVWLKVDGTVGQDDFGLSPDVLLVVSERALDLLNASGVSNLASEEPYEG